MTPQELQYLLQIMNNADIKGQQSVFHAQLMSKLSLLLQHCKDKPNQEKAENANGDT